MRALYKVHIDGSLITRIADTHVIESGGQLMLAEEFSDETGKFKREVAVFNRWDYIELEYRDG